jgi:hypothetical protein
MPTSSQAVWFIAVALICRAEGDHMLPLFRRVTLGVGLALVLSLVVISAQGTDPLVGTWKLNVAASSYSPGPPPKSMTKTYEDRGGGVLLSVDKGVDAKGNPTWNHIAFKYDGKDYPSASSTSQTFDTISYKRVDATTIEYTVKRDGKVATITTRTISKDGKTLTDRTKGTNAQGQPVNNVAVCVKQ